MTNTGFFNSGESSILLAGRLKLLCLVKRVPLFVYCCPAMTIQLFKPATILKVMSLLLCVNVSYAVDVDGQITIVEQNIRKMARVLNDLADDRDLRQVSTLRSMVSEARKSAIVLARIGAGDDHAEKLVLGYDKSLDRFAESYQHLAELKQLQFVADEGEKKCVTVEKQLYSKIENLVHEADIENLDDIEVIARSYARQANDLIIYFNRTLKRAKDEADDAKAFNESAGPWKNVSGAVEKTADKMHRHLYREIEKTKRACKAVLKGERNTKIKTALAQLEQAAGNNRTASNSSLEENEIRKEIRAVDKDISAQLKTLTALLHDIAGDESPRNIDRAIGQLRPLGKTILRLKAVVNFKTSDRATKSELKKAKGQLNEYPKALTDLNKSLISLKLMKQAQFDLDDSDEQCLETEKNFTDDIEAWVKKGGEDALEEIGDDAEALESETSLVIKDATKFVSDYDKLTRNTKLFAYRKGSWNSLEKTLDATAEAMKKHVDDAFTNLSQACEHLLEPYELAVVEDAIAELKDFQEQVDDFKLHSETWFQKTREVFTLTCETLNEARDVACAGDIDSTSDPDIARLSREIAGITSTALREIKEVLPEYKKLRSTGNAILKQEEEKEVTRLLSNMEKRVYSLQKTIKSGQLKGSRNPFIQMATRYGVAHHKSMENQSKFDCVVQDMAIPNLRVRPDCISASKCTVYEFKPDSPGQEAAGLKQALSYAKEVAKVTNDMLAERYKRSRIPNLAKEGSLEQKEDAIGDDAYLNALWDHHCVTKEGGEVIFHAEVALYDKCKSQLKLECPVE